MLHVTNGDSVVETMRQAHVVGDVVAWRDVLHEGPVPALDPAELRAVRARFLATGSFFVKSTFYVPVLRFSPHLPVSALLCLR